VVVLVDTSQSMSIEDERGLQDQTLSRDRAVVEALSESPVLEELLARNRVSIQAFDRDVRRVAGWPRTTNDLTSNNEQNSSANSPEEPRQFEWVQELLPEGNETRLGSALKATLEEAESALLAGIIIISDGVQNTGVEAVSAVESATQRNVPIYTVGVGSTEERRNVRIQDLNAPARVYPDDRVTITGTIRGEGFAGRSVEVQLYARDAEQEGAESLVGSKSVAFEENQESQSVQFEIEPAIIGRLSLEMRIVGLGGDQSTIDNHREAEIEVVEAKSNVLLIAGGPSRDYQFLRNQLYRDKHASVDVWIQSAPANISQESDQILYEFPQTREELYAYDCIIGFDPNWEMLDARQIEMLESWVADEAGGMIVVAGPIHTASWSQNPEQAKMRALYPVEFQRRLTLLDDGLYGSETPWPILFSREGEDARYLWLADDPEESRLNWSDFPGVYGCYAVKGPKPGARVLGWYGDPDASLTADYPVYFAEQFYGGGRVFYMGSGELWRLRSLDPGHFETLTTRLIRHVSQGRLLKGSSRGRLLVEQDRYTVGDDVVVRAQVLSASREPLIASQLIARVVDPSDQSQNVVMLADESRPGNYMGQFGVKKPGSYRVELAIPDAVDEQLVRRIQVVVPDLEFDRTRRDEVLLTTLASMTGGVYYPSLTAAIVGEDDLTRVSQLIESRAETRILRGTPDTDFALSLNSILLAVIAGALSLEWLLRRLVKLA